MLQPEDIFQIQCAELFDLLCRSWRFTWCHIPNEGKRSPRAGALLKRKGLKPGWSDNIIIKPGGSSFLIELKTDDGRESRSQLEHKERCRELRIRRYLCRTIDEVIAALEHEFGRKIDR